MREYLFRGKRLDNGEWAQGQYLYDDVTGKGWITLSITESQKTIGGLFVYCVEVDPETVGQFTGGVEFGLEGAEERKIFDGDIVQVLSGYGGKGVFLVVWNYESAGWYWKHLRGTRMFYGNEAFGMKILGNRWDNPELLEGTP